MKKQYKAPEIEVLLFDFREIAMTQTMDTGLQDTTNFDDSITDPWTNNSLWIDEAAAIENNIDNIN